jgi:hypothetical protein
LKSLEMPEDPDDVDADGDVDDLEEEKVPEDE